MWHHMPEDISLQGQCHIHSHDSLKSHEISLTYLLMVTVMMLPVVHIE